MTRGDGVGPTAEELFAGPGESMAALRATDWSATALGPVDSWRPELVAAIRTVLRSRLPTLLWWGPDLIQLYNDACLRNLGDKHPAAAGQPAAQCWHEVWDALRPVVQSILDGRQDGVRFDEQLMFFTRRDYVEETYQTYSLSGVRDETGAVLGIFVQNPDGVTAQVLDDRRLRTLRELGSVPITAGGTATDACRKILKALAGNRADVPFGSIYLMDDSGEPQLIDHFGFRPGALLPPREGTNPVARTRLRRTATNGEPLLITGMREQFPDFYDPTGALDDAEPDSSLMLPLVEHGRSERLGVLVLGISPHRRFDADYRAFFHLVADHVSIAITDALAFEAERVRVAALAEIDAAKTRFFQNISHELRTPLTLVLAPLQQVLDDPALDLPDEYRHDLQAARRAARRLQRLVDGLLDVTRGEVDRLAPATEPTDIGSLTGDCVSMFRSAVESAGLTLSVELPEPALSVLLDRQMWSHIVLNLLSNAVKFTLHGGITVRVERAGDVARLTVRDTGIGIPEQEIPLIFDRFHRVVDQPARTGEGAGIGLSLVADLVRAHGGTIRVDSALGTGSTFDVTVPATSAGAARPHELPQDIGEMFLADAAQWSAPSSGPAADELGPAGESAAADRQGRLLVVEDNADMRGYLTRLLRQDGWSVHPCATVDAALSHPGTPDLVLSDVMMPARGGLDLLRMLRAGNGSQWIPVMLLTARAGPESIAEGMSLGADDYLVKPFEPIELLARVRSTVELHRRHEHSLIQLRERAENLEAALSSNRRIGTAVGVLMASRKVDSETAFELLSTVSQLLQRKLRDVADEVVATGALPSR